MWSSNGMPWMKINEFLLYVEVVREPKAFSEEVIKKLFALIPYDQARVFIIANGKVHDMILLDVDKDWSEVYLKYYSKIEDGRYSIFTKGAGDRDFIPGVEGAIVDWTGVNSDQFINEYIRPQGLHYSAGFKLNDTDELNSNIFCLDRIGYSGFSQREIEILRKIVPHLKNLYKNVFIPASALQYPQNPGYRNILTKREFEIAGLLCKGMTPTNIGNRYDITLPTVYRHIANIHQKLDVSTRQELILKLLGYVE